MGLLDKFKDFINASDEDYLDGTQDEREPTYDPEDFEYEDEQPTGFSAAKVTKTDRTERDRPRVVDIRSSSASRPHVVFKKLEKFDEVVSVADVLNEKRIVILNLETCPNDISRRIIDFLYGVAYANEGEIKRVAGRAYIITPYNVPVTGELLDELDSSAFTGKFFE